MPVYRLQLLNQKTVVAVLDIRARSNQEAAMLATGVFQSCAEICTAFELRRETAWIAGMTGRARKKLNLKELPAQMQHDIHALVRSIPSSRKATRSG